MGQHLVGEAACQDKGLCGCWAQEPDNKLGEISPPPGSLPNPGVTAGASIPERGAAAASSPPLAPGPPPAPSAPTTSVSFDYILSDLEGAEQVAYGEAFVVCSGSKSTAQMDNVSLREFMLNNSAIAPDDLDPHLLQVASEEGALTMDGFLHVLRENAVSDSTILEQFLGMTSNGNGETVAAEECRTGLLLFSQRHMSANFMEEKWDRIFNTVMWDADVTVSMEKWMFYCKVVCRIIRLSQYCRA